LHIQFQGDEIWEEAEEAAKLFEIGDADEFVLFRGEIEFEYERVGDETCLWAIL